MIMKTIESYAVRMVSKVYGYESELDSQRGSAKSKTILDAGCGLGYKAAWFANLSPNSLVVCMDFSDAIFDFAKR